MMNAETIIKDNNLKLVARADFGYCYDWAELEVYYSVQKNLFFWVEGEGCSCLGLWDEVTSIMDLKNGSRQAAAEAVRRFAATRSEADGWFVGDGNSTAVSKVMSF